MMNSTHQTLESQNQFSVTLYLHPSIPWCRIYACFNAINAWHARLSCCCLRAKEDHVFVCLCFHPRSYLTVCIIRESLFPSFSTLFFLELAMIQALINSANGWFRPTISQRSLFLHSSQWQTSEGEKKTIRMFWPCTKQRLNASMIIFA